MKAATTGSRVETTPNISSTPIEEMSEANLTIINLNAQILGFTFGILFAFGMFFVTIVLVLKGGADVGSHLKLLGHFLYGYKVTLAGSVLGGAYGAIVGYASGFAIAVIYNWVAYLRSR